MGIETLVICSTLNQITNYLLIKKYEPNQIINITLESTENYKTGINIKNEKWDEYLKETFEQSYNIKPLELHFNQLININEIYNILKRRIKSDKIYWNITGGQRTIALAVQRFIRECQRVDDKILYIEGNSEKLLVEDYEGNVKVEKYFNESLSIEKALKLVGFQQVNSLEMNLIEKTKEDMAFYLKLYDIIIKNEILEISINKKYKNNKEKLTFRKHLLNSNKQDNCSLRKSYLEDLINFFSMSKKYNITEEELRIFEENISGSYPVGTIFEKIVGYKLLNIIKENDLNVVDMRLNCKINFNDEEHDNSIVDEIDIIMLTNVGKLIMFECKSGGMSGDNAKSHRHTTYRLSGVFGTPIFLSPLLKEEYTHLDDIKKDQLIYKSKSAYKSAIRAELEMWGFDEIESKFEELMKIY